MLKLKTQRHRLHMNSSQQIELAIEALQNQRALLGDAAVDAAIGALRIQLASRIPAQEQALRLTGERKLVTVMFADISGFTALSEKLDPEEVRAVMNACFDCLVPVINEYQGTVDKFIGDEIMALFGAPKAHERHAELACGAALGMFEALQQFNHKNRTSLDMHIGINTGLVIAGGIGSEGRQEYSVMGDAVNLAARLKDAATRGEVFVGSEVQALTNHHFNFNALPPLRLKGKNELVRTWRLQSRKTQPGIQREGTLRSTLIGRETELRALTSLFFNLENGQGSRISIIGDAGIGKSRLMTEVQQQVENRLVWVEGRSLSYTRQRAYQPAFEIMSKLLTSSTTAVDDIQLKALLQEELERILGAEGQSCLPFLCHMMQLPLSEEEEISVRYLKGNALREKIFAALAVFLNAKARIKPLILVWEDLHWADPSSLTLIEDLMSLCDSNPISIVLVLRPQKEEKIWQLHEQTQAKYGNQYHTFSLEPLTVADCATLARNLMYVENLAPEVEKIIMEKAEGNPFFMEELLRSLLDKGLLYLEGQMIKASENLDTLVIPGTLQGVIASRIDQLEEMDKHILQIASILGRIFREAVLDALLVVARKNTTLPPSLQRLVDRELLRNRPYEEAELAGYIFKHAVTHDVAYNSLLLADRKILHRLAGETVEKLAEANHDDYAETLAYHYERADQQEKAVHFLRIAARRAKKLHFNEEAVELYRRAIRQAEELMQRDGKTLQWRQMLSELFENQADILKLTGQIEPAKTAYNTAIDLLDANDWIGRSRNLRKTGMCLQALSQFQLILDYFQQARQLLEQWQGEKPAEWWHEWLEIMIERMFMHYWVNQPDAIQELAKTIEPHLERYATPIQQSRYYSYLGSMNFRIEGYLLSEQTVSLAKMSVDTALISKDLQVIGLAKFFLGFSHLWRNQMEECIKVLEESLALADKTGDIVTKARCLTYLAVAHRRLGNAEQTEHFAHKSLETSQQAKMVEYVGTSTANLAWLAWKNKDLEKLEILGKQAYAYWEKVPEMHSSLVFDWTAAFPMAALYWQRGNLPKCMERFESMLKPGRKRLEADLTQNMKMVLEAYNSASATMLHEDVAQVLQLAEKYRYL